MIENHKKKYGWEILFIGVNIDAGETAKHFGIDADRAVDYHAVRKGTAVLYDTVSETVCHMRTSAPISSDWSSDIKKDFESRK